MGEIHALLITLVYSRHQFVYTTTSQQIPDLVADLEDAWEYFGGVPTRAGWTAAIRFLAAVRGTPLAVETATLADLERAQAIAEA